MNEDLESFASEIMLFLTEEEIEELKDKAGVSFPLNGNTWSDLCYVCFWVSINRKLPPELTNRMILGDQNIWIKLYAVKNNNNNNNGVCFQEKMTLEDFFNIAG